MSKPRDGRDFQCCVFCRSIISDLASRIIHYPIPLHARRTDRTMFVLLGAPAELHCILHLCCCDGIAFYVLSGQRLSVLFRWFILLIALPLVCNSHTIDLGCLDPFIYFGNEESRERINYHRLNALLRV